ncbi:FAD:protein FMN transferase [Shimia sp. NS0008-38b]|uniref:FAD:protein FMN transferase n=1 Tax=Shimia sp. NS0008-38b TaxID=3127653 RepID=UPI0031045CA6
MTTLSRRSFIFMALALAACKRGAADILLTGQTMGTTYTIVGVNAPGMKEAELSAAVQATLTDVDIKMSNWNSRSEVSRLNALAAGDTATLSSDMATLMHTAQDVFLASDGQFDITLGPLIDLWGFGATRPPGTIPPEAAIADAQKLVGLTDTLAFDGTTFTKHVSGAGMYLSAIGKGFGVDQVAETLAAHGITDYMVEIGGDIMTSGHNAEGTPWQIAIETPDALQRSILKVVGVSDVGMATSGDYRNYFEHDGVRYSHILDANTGRPVTHSTASVTVLAKNAMLADAWATALLALGTERAIQIAEARGIAAFFIDRNISSGSKEFVSVASTQFDVLQLG